MKSGSLSFFSNCNGDETLFLLGFGFKFNRMYLVASSLLGVDKIGPSIGSIQLDSWVYRDVECDDFDNIDWSNIIEFLFPSFDVLFIVDISLMLGKDISFIEGSGVK